MPFGNLTKEMVSDNNMNQIVVSIQKFDTIEERTDLLNESVRNI